MPGLQPENGKICGKFFMLTTDPVIFVKRYLTKNDFFYTNEKQFLLLEIDCLKLRNCAIMTSIPGSLK